MQHACQQQLQLTSEVRFHRESPFGGYQGVPSASLARVHARRLHCYTNPYSPAQVSEGANKKTLTPEHVVTALQQLGFDDFVAEVEAYWQQFKEDAQVTSWAMDRCLAC